MAQKRGWAKDGSCITSSSPPPSLSCASALALEAGDSELVPEGTLPASPGLLLPLVKGAHGGAQPLLVALSPSRDGFPGLLQALGDGWGPLRNQFSRSRWGARLGSWQSPLPGEKLRPSSRSKFGLGQEGEQNSQAGCSIHCQSSPLRRQGVGLVVTWSASYKNSILGAPGEVPPPPSRCVVCRWGGAYLPGPVLHHSCLLGWLDPEVARSV